MGKLIQRVMLWLAGIVLAPVLWAQTTDLQVQVVDQQGAVVADAVIEVLVASVPATLASNQLGATVAQKDLAFVPFVSAIPVGTAVDFPNQDKTRHHVYSFSPAKVFELKLYSGKPEQPVTFDKTGVVALGCNIHDYMQAFVYVSASPYLAVTDAQGRATVKALPAGNHQLNVWHPWQAETFSPVPVVLPAQSVQQLRLALTAQQKPQKPKKGFGSS